MSYKKFALIFTTLLWCSNSSAEVYKCTDAHGKTAYSTIACKNNTQQTLVTIKENTLSTQHPQGVAQNSPSQNSGFRCDDRTYCSQMTSCEEAKFF
jgi:Domain of unknown function (DUF4124)